MMLDQATNHNGCQLSPSSSSSLSSSHQPLFTQRVVSDPYTLNEADFASIGRYVHSNNSDVPSAPPPQLGAPPSPGMSSTAATAEYHYVPVRQSRPRRRVSIESKDFMSMSIDESLSMDSLFNDIKKQRDSQSIIDTPIKPPIRRHPTKPLYGRQSSKSRSKKDQSPFPFKPKHTHRPVTPNVPDQQMPAAAASITNDSSAADAAPVLPTPPTLSSSPAAVDTKQPTPTAPPNNSPSSSQASLPSSKSDYTGAKAVRRRKHRPQHRNSSLNSSLTSSIKPSRRGINPRTENGARSRDMLRSSFDTSFSSLVSDLSVRSVDFSSSMEIYYYNPVLDRGRK